MNCIANVKLACKFWKFSHFGIFDPKMIETKSETHTNDPQTIGYIEITILYSCNAIFTEVCLGARLVGRGGGGGAVIGWNFVSEKFGLSEVASPLCSPYWPSA